MGLKFLATIFIATLMSAPAHATEISLVRQVIIRDETGLVLQPNVIVKAGNDDFVVAGSIPGAQEAWATKIDAQGKPIWRYVTGVRDSGLAPGDVPEFRGAAVMKDGSTFLCGYMPTPAGKYLPALLTHLDAAGHMINESLLKPSNSPEHGLSYLDDCVTWKDGVVLLGHVIQFSAGHTNNLYWVRVLDSKGDMKWEKLIPTTFDSLNDIGPLGVAPDYALLFSGIGKGTEVFSLAEDGTVNAQKRLPGAFRLVHNAGPVLEMYGDETSGPFTTAILDSHLDIISQTHAARQFELPPILHIKHPLNLSSCSVPHVLDTQSNLACISTQHCSRLKLSTSITMAMPIPHL